MQVSTENGVSYTDFDAKTFVQQFPDVKYADKNAAWTATNVVVAVAGGEA